MINAGRARLTAIVFLILELPMIARKLALSSWSWSTALASRHFILYLLMFGMSCLFIIAFTNIQRRRDARAAWGIGYFFTLWMLAWAAAISLADQASYQQVTVYASSLFALAIAPYFAPQVIGSAYLLVHVPFLMLLPHFQTDPVLLSGHTINTSTYVVIAWAVSRMLYVNHLMNFCQRMEIAAQNRELEAINRQLQIASSTDGLTGLLNRGTWEQRMQRLFEQCLAESICLAVIMVDIDSFKAFNDSYGHQSGDQCLRSVAQVIDGSVRRRTDVVGRYGGEEFIVAMAQEEETEAMLVAQRIREGVESLGIPHKLSPAGDLVTVSVGFYTAVPKPGESADRFIYQADMALYQAKHGLGNRVVETTK